MTTNHKKIISGKSHSFDTGVAKATGSIEAAILYNDLAHWIGINASNPECHKEGKVWSYSTHKQIASRIGYMNEREVMYAMGKLVDMGLVIKGSFNKNHFDRTNWYTIADEDLQPDPKNDYERQNCSIDSESKKSLRKTKLYPREDKFVPSETTNLYDVYKEKDTEYKDTEYSSPEDAPPSGSPAAKAAPKKNDEFSQEDIKNTQSLIDRLKFIKPDVKIPASLKTWHNQMRLLREVDGRTSQQILLVINWLGGSECWHEVWCPTSLREKFDRIEQRMKNPIKKFNHQVDRTPKDQNGNRINPDSIRDHYGWQSGS